MTQSNLPSTEQPEPETEVNLSQYLTFQLSGDVYAIDILKSREIIEYGSITPVPMMPDFIAGVINLRGAVVPVVDLARRFGGTSSDITKRTSIVIVEVQDEDVTLDVGLIVDTVNEVLDISDTDVEPPPAFGAKIRADFISGMGKVAGKLLIVLEVAKVLSVAELSQINASAGV